MSGCTQLSRQEDASGYGFRPGAEYLLMGQARARVKVMCRGGINEPNLRREKE